MIRAENLTKIFGGKKALDSVSVNIGDGSIYGLVGSNGSGKSTLLRLASGVYMADGGSITSDGEKYSITRRSNRALPTSAIRRISCRMPQ